jgi:8-oxo-dGTP pyrophosphatase MutT (NUDIX family)
MSYPVEERTERFAGKVIRVRTDVVGMPGGSTAARDVVEHPGAVGVVALDPSGRVLLVRQYRHPVGRALWELPAGLLDEPGEPASAAAARELAEEAHLTAGRWDVLVDALTSPGMTDEAIRVFLARGLGEPAGERHRGEHEEAELELRWLPLNEAAELALAGGLENAMAVIGVLAAARARQSGYAGLRPADAPWPARPGHAG